MKKQLLVVAIAALSAGCSILNPYDSEFACPGSTDYGKCTDVAGAYSEALGGDAEASTAPNEKPAVEIDQERMDVAESFAAEERGRKVNRYKAAEYEELAKVIERPVTPIVTPPRLLRTLVVAYATGEKTLYMPRYIFYFANEGEFVLGDYLSAERPAGAGQTIYPNGAR